MHERRPNPARMTDRNPRPGRAAFTIMELLIVVGIIVVLLSIVVVAVNAAMRTSQAANTQALMASINQGLVQFRNDIGYLPPVLATAPGAPSDPYLASRNYAQPPVPPDGAAGFTAHFEKVNNWSSITALPEYLLGYGDAIDDGYGRVPPGKPGYDLNENDGPLGIRHPGPDGYWGVAQSVPGCAGGAPGTLDARRSFLGDPLCLPQSSRFRQGRAYGPYIELRDDRLIGAVEEGAEPNAQGQYHVFFPGDALPSGLDWDDMPKVIVDFWGQPIRYFRKPYVRGNPAQDYRPGMFNTDGLRITRAPTLSDVVVLRPWQVRPGEEMDVDAAAADDHGDTTSTRALHAAAFGLLSAGPDRRIDREVRADEQEFNRDNIVELGR